MKIIENKKLFGKINIVDIIVIIICVICIIIAYKYLSRKNTNISNLSEQRFTICLKDVKEEVKDYINVNDEIYDNEINSYIGKVESFEILPNEIVTEDYDTGEFVLSKVDGLVDIKLNIVANLKEDMSGFKTSEDYVINVGKEILLRGPSYAGRSYVISFER